MKIFDWNEAFSQAAGSWRSAAFMQVNGADSRTANDLTLAGASRKKIYRIRVLRIKEALPYVFMHIFREQLEIVFLALRSVFFSLVCCCSCAL